MGVLTRIRNNQVYNSDIYADAKVVAKSISGGLLSDNFTYTGNMTIGNLTVNGNTTTADTVNLVVSDPLIAINRNQSGTPSYDLGMIMGRGNQTNVAFIWEETAKQFQLMYTTESTAATTFGVINNSGYANLQAYGVLLNNATITTATLTNSIVSNTATTGGTINNTTIGATTPNTGVFTSVTTSSGGQLIGYHTGAIGANGANTGAFTTLTTSGTIVSQGTITGAGQIIGYFNGVVGANAANSATFTTANVNGTMTAGTLNAGTIGNSGAVFSGATSTLTGASQAASFTTSGGGQLIGYFTGAIGANTPNTGVFTSLTTTGTLSAATINAGTIGNAGASIYGGNIAITGNALIQNGLALNTNASIVTDQATASVFNTVPTTINIGGGATTINLAKNDGTSAVKVNGTANSYGSGQGALQISGGFYAGGDSYIRGNLIVGNLQSIGYQNLVVNDPLLYLSAANVTSYNYDIGFYSHKFDSAVGYNHTGLVRRATDNNWYLFSNIRTEPDSTVDLGNATVIYDTLLLGNMVAYSGNASTSKSTGALVVYGGAGILGNIYAGAIQNTPIGNGTASTGAFTTLTTSSTITSQGTISAPTINAGTIGNSGATFTGASQTLTGNVNALNFNGSGTITINNMIANGGTSSYSTTAGSLIVSGGAGISGNVNAGKLQVGALGYSDTNILILAQSSVNTYNQIISQNTNNGSSASTDIVVNNDQSTASTYYGDFGINSSGFTGTGSLAAPNNVYLTSTSSDLVLGTTTSNAIRFVVNSGATDSLVIDTNGNVVILDNTASTSTTTGALVVNGGIGVSGSINSGANVNAASTVNVPSHYTSNIYPYANSGNVNVYTVGNSNLTVNANQLVANLVVHGNGAASYQNLLVTNGATGQVGIRVAPNAIVGNVGLQVNTTDSMIIPTGAQAARPTNAQRGMIRYNTNNDQLEFYNGTTWTGTGSTFTIVTSDQFVGNGTQTQFTLSQSTSTNGTIVAINGVIQIPTTAYSVSGTTLTFTEAPLSTDVIDARSLVTTSTVTSITDATGGNTFVANAAGSYVTVVNTAKLIANTSSNFFSGGISTLNANTSLSPNVPTIIDSFDMNTFRGAKYVVTVSDYTNSNFQLSEIVLVTSATTATVQTYGVVASNGTSISNFYANVSGTTARLYANSSVSSVAKVQQIYMPL